jgi:DNA-binding response OmpR family regulator
MERADRKVTGAGRRTGEPVLVIAPRGPRLARWRAELTRHGFIARFAWTPLNGIAIARDSGVTLIVVYAADTAGRGIGIIRGLRDEGNPAVILALTRQHDALRAVECMESGADSCVSHRCSSPELIARLRALTRRQRPQLTQPALWLLGDLRVDPSIPVVARGTERIALSPREFALLLALLRRRGRIVSHQEIRRDVWRTSSPNDRRVASLILNLRRKLERNPGDPRYIVTARSHGYLIPSRESGS